MHFGATTTSPHLRFRFLRENIGATSSWLRCRTHETKPRFSDDEIIGDFSSISEDA